jgi:hypothetical protein
VSKPANDHPYRETVILGSDHARRVVARNKRTQVYRVFRRSDDATLGWCGNEKKAEELCAALGADSGYE